MIASNAERPERFSKEQSVGLGTRRTDQDRTLAAMHQLEAALEAADPGREASWREEVIAALTVLDESMKEEGHNASEPDSLLSDVARNQPRLGTRVRGIRAQYRQLQDRIESLRRELEGQDEVAIDVADLRQRLASMLIGLRHQRGRESDLIYEAYYEAFRAELDEDRV